MTPRLQDEIQQTQPFGSRAQEAFLSIGRTWGCLEHAFSDILRPYGITPTQYNVLRILRGAGETGLCRSAVMERMVTQVPDATRLLDRMETAGLIRRQRSEEDRRFVITLLTEEGLRLVNSLDEPVMALHGHSFSQLGEAELEQLTDLLGLVRDRL